MKALAINGSPRAGGNTEILLKQVLAPLDAQGWDTEYIHIGGKPVHGCMACMKCVEKQNHRCIIDNDFVNNCLEKMFAADAIILGSPTYVADVTTEMKALIDRAVFVSFANGSTLTGKIGAAVVAARRGGATHVFDTINHMFLVTSMIVPGSVYWNLGYGTDQGEVHQDEDAARNMQHLGQAIDWLGQAISLMPRTTPYPKQVIELG